MLEKINAVNNGQPISNYEYLHKDAPDGKNYYRLVIVSKDGSSKLSEIRLVTVNRGVIVNVYPNPVKDKLHVSFNNPNGKPGTITLVNTFGQHMLKRKLNGTTQIDMAAYAAGMYLLQVDDGNKVTTYKIQKQ